MNLDAFQIKRLFFFTFPIQTAQMETIRTSLKRASMFKCLRNWPRSPQLSHKKVHLKYPECLMPQRFIQQPLNIKSLHCTTCSE